MNSIAAASLRYSVRLSPLVLAALSAPPLAQVMPSLLAWPILLFACAAASYGSFTAARERIPAESWIHGLKTFVPRRKDLRPFESEKIENAKQAVKILDSYWGDVDFFRTAIQSALVNGQRTEVRVLIAKRTGHFAQSRAAGVPSEVLDVDRHLPDTQRSLDELRAFLKLKNGSAVADRLVVRSFDAVVAGPMIIVDDEDVFVGAFLQNAEGSPGAPALWLSRGRFSKPAAIDAYIETFDVLWSRAERLT